LAVNVFNFHQLEKKLILKVIPTISWIRGCYSAVVDFLIILSYDYLKCYIAIVLGANKFVSD